MYLITHLTLGFGISMVAMILPGMVNMSAVNVAIKRGLKAGIWYSAGAAMAILLYAYLAIAFAGYLGNHPEVFLFMKKVAIVIFLGLSFVFGYQALKSKMAKTVDKPGLPMLTGFSIAGMNVLNLPFFFTMGTLLEARGWITLQYPLRQAFICGITLGCFFMLSAYAAFAQYIARHAQHLTRNLNYFLCGLFLLLAFIQLVQLYLE